MSRSLPEKYTAMMEQWYVFLLAAVFVQTPFILGCAVITYQHYGYEDIAAINFNAIQLQQLLPELINENVSTTEVDVIVADRPTPISYATEIPFGDEDILPDNTSNDSVYGQSLGVAVNSRPAKTKYYKKPHLVYGGAMARFHNTTPPVTAVAAENFTRTTSPGAMDVNGFKHGADIFAPSQVTDLTAVIIDKTSHTVRLSWTAPGDDLTTGNASRYDLRISQNSDDLRRNFSMCTKITPTMIVHGSLIPNPAGTLEELTLQTPVNWTTVVFALQTFDEVPKGSKISKTATITYKEVVLVGQTTTLTPTTTSTRTSPTHQTNPTTTSGKPDITFTKKKPEDHVPVVVAVVVVAVLVVVVIICVIIAKIVTKSKVHAITDPFSAKMTEPSVPNVHFTYGLR